MPSKIIRTILLATGNSGKVREFEQMFADLPVTLISLIDLPEVAEVAETGTTFAENARIKAISYARQTGHWSLADDSGLAVDALNGEPGVMSARYGGPGTCFAEKMELVLQKLEASDDSERSARFVCSIAIADETGRVVAEAEGECPGHIAKRPKGSRGFGYDPIFVPDGYEDTFGELDDEVKAQISHRARASAKIIRYLLDFTGIPT